LLGADAQALGHTGAEALDQPVGAVCQLEHGLDAAGVLEIHPHAPAPPVQHVEVGGVGNLLAHPVGPVHPHHICPQISQHHGRERSRSDAGDLYHANAFERSHAAS